MLGRRPRSIMTDDELLAQVQTLLDIEAIKRLKARYFRAVDSKDVASWRELFTEDATFQALGRTRRGRDEIVEHSGLVHPDLITVHHGHMPELEITGPATATGVWAMYDHAQMTDAEGSTYTADGYGHYHETYVKRDGRWLIASLRLTRLRLEFSDGAREFFGGFRAA
jgi:uncharacterized protein (TIGR02246 family)